MKLTFFLFAVLFTVRCSSDSAQSKVIYSDLRRENIKGDISQMKITQYTCDSTGKQREMQDCCATVMEYNEDGNLLKQTSTNKEGNVTEVETTTMHENGLRTSVTTTRNGTRVRYMVFTVNEAGVYGSGKVLDSTDKVQMYYENLVINEYGQPVSFTLYGKDSSIVMKETAKYNGNLLISYVQTDKNGKQIASYEHKYNDKGESIEETTVETTDEGEQKKIRRHTYNRYDEKGNWTKMTEWDDKGKAVSILAREFVYRQ